MLHTTAAAARVPLARTCQCQLKSTSSLSRTRSLLLRTHIRLLSTTPKLQALGDTSTIDYFQFPRNDLFDAPFDPKLTQEFIKVPYPPDSYLLEARSEEHADAAQELEAIETELVHTSPGTVFAVAGADSERLLNAVSDVIPEVDETSTKVEEGSWQYVWQGFLEDLMGKKR